MSENAQLRQIVGWSVWTKAGQLVGPAFTMNKGIFFFNYRDAGFALFSAKEHELRMDIAKA